MGALSSWADLFHRNGHANGHSDPVANAAEQAYLAVANAFTARRDFFARILDKRRSIENECGYPPTPEMTAAKYQDLFDRDPIANRVVSCLADAAWEADFSVYEDEDSETPTTFEAAVDDLQNSLRGEQNWYQDEEGSPLWPILREADIKSRIGRYGVLFLGLDDGLDYEKPDYSQPVRGIVETGSVAAKPGAGYSLNGVPRYSLTANAAQTKGRKLLFLCSFSEAQAAITQFEKNPSSPRYGQPVQYQLTFHDSTRELSGSSAEMPETIQLVHWSRVIHLSRGHVYHVPEIQPVLNRILDLQKIYGADGESYWLNAFAHYFFESNFPDGIRPDMDTASIRDAFESMRNSSKREMILENFTAKTISPMLADPSPHVDVHLDAVCIQKNIPKRIFIGSERGELASSQDERDWRQTKQAERAVHTKPRVICPLFNRLITVGCLPEPKQFSVWCSDADDMTASEKAAILVQKTQAYSQYVSSGMEQLVPPMDYMTRFDDLDEEEAQSIIDNATSHQEDMLAQQIDERQQKIDAGLAPDPNAMPAPVDGQQVPGQPAAASTQPEGQ